VEEWTNADGEVYGDVVDEEEEEENMHKMEGI
jgi:hypothetical protein